jgi:putative ABC transport system permease protein
VQKQVNFGSSNLGINQDNVIGIKLTPELMGKREVLKKMLLEKPSVGKISFSQYYPGQPLSYWETKMDAAGEPKQLSYDTFGADAGFFETMGLQLVSGRFYSEDLSTDANKVVVNESFARENKLQTPLGVKFFSMNGSVCEIIGVIKDFHYKPVNKPILPLAIRNEPFASYCLVNLQTSDYSALNNAILDIRKSATGLSPSFPVEISFLDQAIENLYQSELQFRRTFSLFAGCAIVICCLGILAVSLFACQRRVKEIGIRKVNGARIAEVIILLNRDFVKWVTIAFVIATPLSWFILTKWLENFAYQTNLSWWIFALAGLLALGIALFTVSWQSWKAATRNPVEALRYE